MKAAAVKCAALALLVPWGALSFAQGADPAPPPAATAPAQRMDPNALAAHVKQALRQAQGDKARDILVTVHADTLVLTGKVDDLAQASAATALAQAAADGARVSNQLEVRPADENLEQRREQQLVREVEAALRADPKTANLGVAASIDENGVIGLHGLVPSREDRDRAERVATQVAGARQLKNHLAVPGER